MGVEFVGIELELRGEEAVYSDLQKIDRLLNSLGGRKKVDAGLQNLKRDILAARGELEKFQRLRQKYLEAGGKGDAFSKEIQEAKYHLKDLQQAQREVTLGQRQMGDTFKQTFNKISSSLTHAGSKMQTLGNALQKLTSPFERFTTGMIMGAGYKAFGKFTEGLESGFERADIMRKFPRVMEAMGMDAGKKFAIGAGEAKTAIDNLNDAVLGLPTGLDEMVSMAQRFISTTGELERGTELAIAANNAFLASMTTESQRYQGMMQLQDVIGGKDMTAKEWNSLYSSMTGAVRLMGESLGYTGKELDEYTEKVRTGKIANKDFLDALVNAGADPTGKIRKVAEESMDTWEAFFSRIKTASSNLMYKGILEPLDEIVKTVTDGKFKSVNLLLDDFIYNGINNMRNSIADWVRAHPEQITDFFKSLKQIDFKGFVKGLAEGVGEMAKVAKGFADAFGGKDLSGIGKWMIRLNMLGKFLTIFGGLTKGLSHPIAGLLTVLIRGTRAFKKRGLLGALGDLIAGESLSNLDTATEKIDKSVPTMGKFGSGLSKFFKGWAQVATMIGGSALVGAVSFKAFKSIFKDIKEIGNIIGDTDWGNASKGLIGIGGFLTAFMLVSKKFGGAGGLTALKGGGILAGLTAIFAGTFWADMAMIKRGFKAIADATEYMNIATDNLGKIKSIDGGVKDRVSDAIAAFNEITQLLAIERNNPVTGQGESGLKELNKKSAETIKNLAESLGSMESAITTLNKINGMNFDTSNIRNMMTNLSSAMTQVGNLYDMLPDSITTGDAIWKGENIAQSLTNIQNIFSKLVGEGGILSQIPQITQRMAGLQRSGSLEALGGQLDSFKNAMKDIWSKLNMGLSDGDSNVQQLTNLETALGKVRGIINKVNSLASLKVNPKGTSNIKTALESIKNAFSDVNVSDITGQINSFIESIKSALDSIKELDGVRTINASVKLSSTFNSSVNTVVNQINRGKNRIRTAFNSIPSTLTKTISVTISASVNTAGAVNAINQGTALVKSMGESAVASAQNPAKGGMIYRAKGGNVPFRRRGTDTVPAMLTPGEYVHNKRAVNLFGVDFMRKVNNLDMRGAMHELMTRAGSMANVGRNTVINNYYNNNQKVTQNINNPSPSFAINSASRLVGAFK